MENNKDIINGKIEEAIAILMTLASNYKFDFILNYTSSMKGVISGIAYNEGMNMGILDLFINNLSILKSEVNLIPNMLQEGYFIVVCVDDSNKPTNFKGDWIIKNHIYIVESIKVVATNKFCYILKDLRPLKPYEGFYCERFVRIIENCLYN